MTDNYYVIKKSGFILLFICSILEALLFPDSKNLLGCAVSLYGWFLFSKYIFTIENLNKFLLPTLTLVGYIICYYFFPLIVTLSEGKPITYNFEVPILTFTNNFLNVSIITFSFLAAKRLTLGSSLRKIWDKLGYFNEFSEKQVWIIGLIGLICWTYYVTKINTSMTTDDVMENVEGGLISSLIRSIGLFASFPLFLWSPEILKIEVTTKKITIVIYMLVYAALCMASTNRSALFYPIVSLILFFVIISIRKGKQLFQSQKTILYIIGSLLVLGPLSDLAFAMSLNRHIIEGAQTFNNVWKLFSDKEELHKLRSIAISAINNSNDIGWSEYYVDNVFMDRFCNLRVQDATLYYATELGYNDEGMHNFAMQFFTNDIPTPILHALGINKELASTPADYICMRYFNTSYRFGNRVSGDTGTGLFWMGYWYYPFAFFIYIAVFSLFSSFIYIKHDKEIIPLPIICTIMTYFTYFVNSYGILWSIHMLIRGGLQQVLVFCIVGFIAKKIIR